MEQALSLRVLGFFRFGTIGGGVPVDHSIVVIHHPQYQRLIGRIYWSDRDVADSSKLTTIVQMFVLKTEKVPNKATGKKEYLINGYIWENLETITETLPREP